MSRPPNPLAHASVVALLLVSAALSWATLACSRLARQIDRASRR